MSKVIIDGKVTYINPGISEFDDYQERGLEANERQPNDYLRMVAKVFGSLRDTSISDNLTSYISGFAISYTHELHSDTLGDDLGNYHSFTINPGNCIIDNQLINFSENTLLVLPEDYFNDEAGKVNGEYIKYCIVVFYSYRDQYTKEIASIEIWKEDDLTFPDLIDQPEKCFYYSTSVTNTVSTSKNYGLVIGSFNHKVGLPNKIVKDLDSTGISVEGINSQNLAEMYMNNYKLLFEYFGVQARKVFSDMSMTNNNFIVIPDEQIHPSLKSGMFCFYDPIECKYMPSRASQRKIDQIIGLYLKESVSSVNGINVSGSNIIFFNGVVQLDDKFILDDDDTLKNLIPGQFYYLADRCTERTELEPIIDVPNYTTVDTSGKISPRFFTGSVQVGTAVASNLFLININKEQEISVANLMDIFGSNESFEVEYLKQKEITLLNAKKKLIEKKIEELQARKIILDNLIGDNLNIVHASGYSSISDYEGEDNNSAELRLIIGGLIRRFFGYSFINNEEYSFILDNFSLFVEDIELKNTNIINHATGELDLSAFEDTLLKDTDKVLTDDDIILTDDKIVFDVLNGNDNTITESSFDNIKYLLNNNSSLTQIINILTPIIVLLSVRKLSDAYVNINNTSDISIGKVINQLLYDLSNFEYQLKEVQEYSKLISISDQNLYTTINAKNLSYMYNDTSIGYDDISVSASEIADLLTTNINNQNIIVQSNEDNLRNNINYNKMIDDNIYLARLCLVFLTKAKNIYINERQKNILDTFDYTNQLLEINESLNNIQNDSLIKIPYAIDIFLMDEHQRKVFNYTYLTLRLRKKIWERQLVQDDLNNANTSLLAVASNPASTLVDQLAVQAEVNRLTNTLNSLEDFIINTTSEYNNLRSYFGEAPVELYDIDFIANYTDESVDTYRFGCDNNNICYNGVCSNTITACEGLLFNFRRSIGTQSDVKSYNDIIVEVYDYDLYDSSNPDIDYVPVELMILRHTSDDMNDFKYQWIIDNNLNPYRFEEEVVDTIQGQIIYPAGSGGEIAVFNNYEDNIIVKDVYNSFTNTEAESVETGPRIGYVNDEFGGSYTLGAYVKNISITDGISTYQSTFFESGTVDTNSSDLFDKNGTPTPYITISLSSADRTFILNVDDFPKTFKKLQADDDGAVIAVTLTQSDDQIRTMMIIQTLTTVNGIVVASYKLYDKDNNDTNIGTTIFDNDALFIENLDDNNFSYQAYSTDSALAISNFTHDPAKMISSRLDKNIFAYGNSMILKIYKEVWDSVGNMTENVISSVKFKFERK